MVTTIYFEIDNEDDLRKTGFSKDKTGNRRFGKCRKGQKLDSSTKQQFKGLIFW